MAKHQPSQRHNTPPPGRKTKVWIITGVSLVLFLLMILCVQILPESFPRLEIAGYQISREEYLQVMYQARNDVLSDHADRGISLTDWSQKTNLGDPCELVTQRTLEILREYYAVSTLAVERGYLADASYDALQQDMEEVNRKQLEAMQAGAVITGMPNFTLDSYITYRASSIRLQFCNDPNNPDARVTQEELRQRYEADKDRLYSQPDSLELAYLIINAKPEEADALEADLQKLRQLTLEKGDLHLALEDFPHLSVFYQEASITPANYSIYDRSQTDLLACTQGLETGDISQVFRQACWFCLVQCRQRIAGGHASLEDVASVVEQSIRESRYDDIIAKRMKEMEVSADFQGLYRFTSEQFT